VLSAASGEQREVEAARLDIPAAAAAAAAAGWRCCCCWRCAAAAASIAGVSGIRGAVAAPREKREPKLRDDKRLCRCGGLEVSVVYVVCCVVLLPSQVQPTHLAVKRDKRALGQRAAQRRQRGRKVGARDLQRRRRLVLLLVLLLLCWRNSGCLRRRVLAVHWLRLLVG
jgi:hypothetical protein